VGPRSDPPTLLLLSLDQGTCLLTLPARAPALRKTGHSNAFGGQQEPERAGPEQSMGGVAREVGMSAGGAGSRVEGRVMKAMIFISPPQAGQRGASIS